MNKKNNGGSTPSQYKLNSSETYEVFVKDVTKDVLLQRILICIALAKLRKSEIRLYRDIEGVQDVIEILDLSFAEGNILKAVCRLGKKNTNLYEYNKIRWFAIRLLKQSMWTCKNKEKSKYYNEIIKLIDILIEEELLKEFNNNKEN